MRDPFKSFEPAPRITCHSSDANPPQGAETLLNCAYCGDEIYEGWTFYTNEEEPELSFCSYGHAKWSLDVLNGMEPCTTCGEPMTEQAKSASFDEPTERGNTVARYNGWTNYETWHAAAIIDNTYDLYTFCYAAARDQMSRDCSPDLLTPVLRSGMRLAVISGDVHGFGAPDAEMVDWNEIARHIHEAVADQAKATQEE